MAVVPSLHLQPIEGEDSLACLVRKAQHAQRLNDLVCLAEGRMRMLRRQPQELEYAEIVLTHGIFRGVLIALERVYPGVVTSAWLQGNLRIQEPRELGAILDLLVKERFIRRIVDVDSPLYGYEYEIEGRGRRYLQDLGLLIPTRA
jgi:hypothetical protein